MSVEIILASGSPRRRELLAKMGVTFEIVTAEVEEHMPPETGDAPKLASQNALLKARAVSQLHPDRWILGADTIVVLGVRVLGKPPTLEAAHAYLAALSGQTHAVITGCCLIAPSGAANVFFYTSHVTFHDLSPEIISKYLAAVHVLDKAGAYALQEHGDWLVERIEGSRDNILGLPTERLGQVFNRAGLL
ncbi:MAG: Maf family protein [Verrucomicrobiota bacterium]